MAKYKGAWVRQLPSQIRKVGIAKASWYVEWKEPDGTQRCESCGPGAAGKKAANRLGDRIRAELLTGQYEVLRTDIAWNRFIDEYTEKVLTNLEATSLREVVRSLKAFGRIVKPKRVSSITANMIDTFSAKRQKEKGRKPGSVVSPATVNKDLRNLRTALNVCREWGYIDDVLKIRFLREPKKLPRYVTPEDFAALYVACGSARLPDDLPFSATEWWRALLVVAQMTGWRIGEIMALRWADVDFDSATAITRHRDNKGHRDAKISLHPVVVDHLRRVNSFDEFVFPWHPHRRTLDSVFARIQDAAGIHLTCPDAGDPMHGDCTPACHRYSFHDERRAFATMNAPNMTREALQALMRHQSADTTDRYINMAMQLNPAVESLHVPAILRDDSKTG